MDTSILIAAVSAVMQAIQTGISMQNVEQARDAAKSTFHTARASSRVRKEADHLESLIPEPILATMTERVYACWSRFEKTLEKDKEFLPDEIDDATDAVKSCICRELQRIRKLNQTIPPGELRRWWDFYCK